MLNNFPRVGCMPCVSATFPLQCHISRKRLIYLQDNNTVEVHKDWLFVATALFRWFYWYICTAEANVRLSAY